VHQAGDQPRLYYDARSTNHQNSILRWLGGCTDSVDVAQCTNRWRDLVTVVIKLGFYKTREIFGLTHELLAFKKIYMTRR